VAQNLPNAKVLGGNKNPPYRGFKGTAVFRPSENVGNENPKEKRTPTIKKMGTKTAGKGNVFSAPTPTDVNFPNNRETSRPKNQKKKVDKTKKREQT